MLFFKKVHLASLETYVDLDLLYLGQASTERRDLVPERCRSWSFQVVPTEACLGPLQERGRGRPWSETVSLLSVCKLFR